MESVTSKASRALAASLSASCCMVCSMSVSPITALPSNMVMQMREESRASFEAWSLKREEELFEAARVGDEGCECGGIYWDWSKRIGCYWACHVNLDMWLVVIN